MPPKGGFSFQPFFIWPNFHSPIKSLFYLVDSIQKKNISDYLGQYVTDARRAKMEWVLSQRTRKIAIVLEDIFQPQNASAVIRSCDCFGIQDLHVVENRNKYNLNPDVELGSAQWISLRKYKGKEQNTAECLDELKKNGYTLFATTPHEPDMMLNEIPLDGKVALLMGTEKTGLSEIAIEMADYKVAIPMMGFTESFNISVSAALCMYSLRTRLNELKGWELSEDEKTDLRLEWYKNTVKKSDRIIEEYLKRLKS